MSVKKGLWRDIPVTADDLRALGDQELEEYLLELSPKQLDEVSHLYEFWARPSQLEPEGSDWDTWVFNAGRGAGKTFAGANWVRHRIKCGDKRIACVAPTKGDVRRVMVEGESGFLNMCWKGDKTYKGAKMGYPEWSPTNNTITFDNGATVTFFSAEDPDRLRGPQFHAAWCFIRDTLVDTSEGPKATQDIRKGDLVLTSQGYKAVEDTSVREMPVIKVDFSNGSHLTGTKEHPILTHRGWIPLGQLQGSDKVCVISALSTVASCGTVTEETTTSLTEPQPLERKIEDTFTAGFMKTTSEKYQRVSRYTTSTMTGSTTALTTLWQCQSQTTCVTTSSYNLSQRLIMSCFAIAQTAKSVAKRLLEAQRQKLSLARLANTDVQMKRGKPYDYVSTVESLSNQGLEHSVVSVVSTSQLTGREEVYNIQVEGCHEYIANGILTHNCDEVSSWRNQQDVWDMLQFTLRLGRHPRVMVTTTPKPTKLMRKLLSSKNSFITGGSTFDNSANLASTFLKKVKEDYEGTRLGRQELYAEMLEEAEGALWTTEILDKCLDTSIEDRVEFAKTLQRVVVSIDPATTSNEESDLTGIIVAGIDINGKGYILEDHTDRYTPQGWAAKAISLYHEFSADRIVAERNQGGDMVRTTLTSEDESVPIRLVHASRGKFARAEPVSALYERGKVFHAKGLDELEVQMRTWEPLGSIGSPDRLDAMVWAITDLMLKGIARPQLRLAYSDAKGILNK